MQDAVQTSFEQKTNIEIFVGFSINGCIVTIDPEEGNESGMYNTRTLVLISSSQFEFTIPRLIIHKWAQQSA